MKTCTWMALAALLAVGTQAAGLSGYGAYWSPEDGEDTYGAGVRLTTTSDPTGFLELRASWFEDITDDEDDAELQVIPIEAGIMFNLSGQAAYMVYIGGGVGYYMLDADVTNPATGAKDDVDVDDEWGWYAAGGIEIPITANLSLFGEAIYRQVEGSVPDDDLKNIDSGDVDIKLDGFGANAGIVLKF